LAPNDASLAGASSYENRSKSSQELAPASDCSVYSYRSASTGTNIAPELRLSGNMDFGRVLLRIRDNGPGIPEETMDQIFVPFFTTKKDGSGIGLGLSRQIMTAHRGEIVVESDATGTAVSLLF
jgi:signal transduction histidine kinase